MAGVPKTMSEAFVTPEASETPFTSISLIRHGNVHNPAGIIYGRLPRFRLSERGVEDARRAAKALRHFPLSGMYSSPLLRARQTASIIAQQHTNLTIALSRLITEVDTPFAGKKETSLEKVAGDVYAQQQSGYEQPCDILQRVHTFFRRVRKKHQGKHIAVVTHGDIVLFTLIWACGLEVSPAQKLQFYKLGILPEYPATGSITTLRFSSQDPEEKPDWTYSV